MIQKLMEQIRVKRAPIVVGLDPDMSFLPPQLLSEAAKSRRENIMGDDELETAAEAVWRFNKQIIDATCDLIPAVKPQVAMYEQFGVPGMVAYWKTVRYCKEKGLIVIGDVKRGDIGSTSGPSSDGSWSWGIGCVSLTRIWQRSIRIWERTASNRLSTSAGKKTKASSFWSKLPTLPAVRFRMS